MNSPDRKQRNIDLKSCYRTDLRVIGKAITLESAMAVDSACRLASSDFVHLGALVFRRFAGASRCHPRFAIEANCVVIIDAELFDVLTQLFVQPFYRSRCRRPAVNGDLLPNLGISWCAPQLMPRLGSGSPLTA